MGKNRHLSRPHARAIEDVATHGSECLRCWCVKGLRGGSEEGSSDAREEGWHRAVLSRVAEKGSCVGRLWGCMLLGVLPHLIGSCEVVIRHLMHGGFMSLHVRPSGPISYPPPTGWALYMLASAAMWSL